MKLGLCTIAYRNMDVREVIPHAARIGFEEIEIIGKQVEGKTDSELDSIRECAVDHGLEISGVAPYLWLTQDEKLWRESMKIAERFTQIARRLGARMIRTFTDSGPTGIGSDVATEAQWDIAVKSLQTITANAPEIIFSVETHEKTLADNPASALQLKERVGAGNLLFTYQAFKGGDIIADYEALKEHVRQVHLNPHIGSKPDGDLDDCGVDYASLLQHLAVTGYGHSVAAEFCKEGEATWGRIQGAYDWVREQTNVPCRS
ncbi:sugar phosphate isomerase/epimerase family protein [Cerasicoccus maritimus]|uniref:sugar phosphate isomerase/epimerase family protein n=1 Tax=Cerasicoccus maritimus TaxID=490089 RepID=UPI002852AA71|nr:sugar phosphate isomerase/epimerase [Cerasicoccus maritimus]